MPHAMEHDMSTKMQECIRNCSDCHNTCVQAIGYCLQKGGRHAEPAHLKSLMDCADTCRTNADFMLRGSALYTKACGLCAEACTRCAESCEQFADGAEMKACAELCRRCAATCLEMADMRM